MPKYQWKLLLLASYIFYGALSPAYLLLLLFVTFVTYQSAVWISDLQVSGCVTFLETGPTDDSMEKAGLENKKRKILITTLVVMLAVLIVFKYLSFIFQNISALASMLGFHAGMPVLNLILPVGLSFYLFQGMGYVIDVYRGECKAERNFFRHALFISFFPQLLQGPIGSYGELAPQLFKEHEFDYSRAASGALRIMWGFLKKLVIANQIESVIGVVFAYYTNYSGVVWILALFLYAVELYADFSGYIDIVNGSAEMLGITMRENFDAPYFSSSIAEFWRRWHISLGTWFRSYLFYPVLRSNRMNSFRMKLKESGYAKLASVLPTVFALALVWLCTGVWHGAAWGYILWGVYYGVFICLDATMKQVYSKWRKRHCQLYNNPYFKCFQIVRTFLIVVFGYGIFRPADLKETGYIYSHIFVSGGGIPQLYNLLISNKTAILAIILGTVGLFLTDLYHLDKSREPLRMQIMNARPIVKYTACFVGLFIIALFGAFGESSFIYFGF